MGIINLLHRFPDDNNNSSTKILRIIHVKIDHDAYQAELSAYQAKLSHEVHYR